MEFDQDGNDGGGAVHTHPVERGGGTSQTAFVTLPDAAGPRPGAGLEDLVGSWASGDSAEATPGPGGTVSTAPATSCHGRDTLPMNPRSSEEASMLVRVAEGDPTAVRDVLSRYSALVWSLASGLSNDPHDVEDVVQDIFVDVWRSAGRYDPAVASEATFIATIARRRVIDRRRRAGRRLDPEPLEEEFAPGESDDRLRQIDLHDEANQAREVVAQLTGDRRKVLELSVVDGLTHREIAADTGIPLGTVKSHIRRGLAEVTERLRARRSIQLGEDESPFMEGSL